jgi:hypothetical protein
MGIQRSYICQVCTILTFDNQRNVLDRGSRIQTVFDSDDSAEQVR